jgi:ATP-dependent Zn protease
MTEAVGPASFMDERPHFLESPFSGARAPAASEATEAAIDKAVRTLLNDALERASAILKACRSIHDASTQLLLEKESLAGEDLSPIVEAVRAATKDQVDMTVAG